MAGESLVKTGVKREKDMLYWVGKDGVYGKRRKMPGMPDGRASKVADHDLKLDYSKYLYFLTGDNLTIARKERQVGGSKRKKKAGARKARKGGKKGARKGGKKGKKRGGKKRR
jgi:hypothetical protein